ncbi:MAG TPA: hypothetical protein VGV39_00355 [Mesorhizobium sp.]|jgi:hypothetical protein|uniref:hypothetical protein n=1 Tax=Mesorhizobium sp. TaxID=1871066 RepID=UPI002DDD38ED|nr:hypothetical protein [Mesorhizobium sp.]HEV2501492.1 hypothetical protein [Mesorhizobium sp.]
MGNYSKLIGSIVGGVAGLLVARGLLPAEWATPEIQGAIVVLLSAAATFAFPANRPN